MAILRAKEVKNMDKKLRDEKLKDLKMELIKANVTANKTNAKTKEIKKAISRILTANKLTKAEKAEVKHK
jgi:ribosomal protein L29